MADQFCSSVEFGLKLSQRIYYGKGSVPAPVPGMSQSPEDYLPTAPMCYAVIPEPEIVDNPDIRSYQPYVHGRCDPPALIPLHMHGVTMEIECCLDTAFITVSGTWRVHCVRSGRVCDCRIAIPMGEQGSLLGLEFDDSERSYQTEVITLKDEKDKEKATKSKDGYFLKSQIYTVKIPQVNGGSQFSVRIRWSQKLLYHDGQVSVSVPFSFPAYGIPVEKKLSKKEKIYLNVNSGTATEVRCKSSSHPLKEIMCQVGKLSFSYEAEVPAWSSTDFNFSYSVSSSDISGGVLLQSPFLRDFDQREIFCLYLYPGDRENRKVFKRDVVFIIDISASMRGSPLESVKSALLASLSQLNVHDTFNIIAFNGEVYLFSSSMEPATKEAIANATQWVDTTFSATGGTNILLPLTRAMKLFGKTTGSVPLIFLVTDGAVDNEREICNFVKSNVTIGQSVCTPRLCTYGIGLYCNHSFLQMLAQIGRGHFDAAHDLDSIDSRMQRLVNTASSVIVSDIRVESLESLDSLELFPMRIPDLSCESPLIMSGRYDGTFPDSIKLNGTLADMSKFSVDLKVRRAKEMQLNKIQVTAFADVIKTLLLPSVNVTSQICVRHLNVLARSHIDTVTAHAWFLESKELEEKVSKMSIQNKVPSEYTCTLLEETNKGKKAPESFLIQKAYRTISLQNEGLDNQRIFLGMLKIGFGDIKATAENIPPAIKEAKPTEGLLEKAATNCCNRLADNCCGMCILTACSYVNNQCSVVCTQLCTALACFPLVKCCFELCDCDCDCF